MFEVVLGSARVINIRKTWKTRGRLIPREVGGGGGGRLITGLFFSFLVDGPITGGDL